MTMKFEIYVMGQRVTAEGDIISGPGGSFGIHEIGAGYTLWRLPCTGGYGDELVRGVTKTTALAIASQLARMPENAKLHHVQRILRDHLGGIL